MTGTQGNGNTAEVLPGFIHPHLSFLENGLSGARAGCQGHAYR